MDHRISNRTALQYISVGETMKDERIFKIIEKHREANHKLMLQAQLKKHLGMADEDIEEMIQAHAGALTALKMLEMELKGEKVF